MFRRIRGIRRLFLAICFLLVICSLSHFIIVVVSIITTESPKQRISVKTLHSDFNISKNQADAERPAAVFGTDATVTDCIASMVCPEKTISFSVQSVSNVGELASRFCIAGQRITDNATTPKTVSIVVVDTTNFTIEEVKDFDVSIDDTEFRVFLAHLPDYRLIFISSAGDVTDRLKSPTLSMLENHFGGKNDIRDSPFGALVFIGQKGLEQGAAFSELISYENASRVHAEGCLQLPMGKLTTSAYIPKPLPLSQRHSRVLRGDAIKSVPDKQNCDLPQPCNDDQFGVALFSGRNKDDEPVLCVDGKRFIGKYINDGGRGLNIALLNITSRSVDAIGHFDTYLEESALLELFLESVTQDHLVIVVSFDEAATNFSSKAKEYFQELGSSLVQLIKFRSSWYVIGQKGQRGLSQFEELNFASGKTWAKPISKRLCVPQILGPMAAKASNRQGRNAKRRRFCQYHDGYEDFCDVQNLDKFLDPSPLEDEDMLDNPIFKVPILVVPGLSHNSLRLCLETLLAQAGLNPNFVLVVYDANYPEPEEVAELFNFRAKPIATSASYTVQLAKAVDLLWVEYPDADTAIVIEEELLVTPDFLSFMAQMLPILQNDQKVLAVSAWNVNGFRSASNLVELAYRVEEFPGLAFMIRKSTYLNFMKGKMDGCCTKRAWLGWNVDVSSVSNENQQQLDYYSIIPDVSRIIRRRVDVAGEVDESMENYFRRRLSYSNVTDCVITNAASLMSEQAYDEHLRNLIDSGITLVGRIMATACRRMHSAAGIWRRLLKVGQAPSNTPLVIYFTEIQEKPAVLPSLRRCFGLFYQWPQGSNEKNYWVSRGFYKGILRFSIRGGRPVLLVDTKSSFCNKSSEYNGTVSSWRWE